MRDAAYADQLARLLPPGKAWSRDPASELGQLLLALAAEFARLDGRTLDLIEEIDPRTTVEMLPDWERVAGLPDPAIPVPTTLADRRSALAARLLSRGDPRPSAMIAIAAAYGFVATITTHIPFAAGVGYAGAPLYAASSRFWWEMTITAPIGTTTPMVALEHFVRRATPDHSFVTFNYNLV
jgi:uncharacterized protein YmfQ (DUF2313 family)